MSRNLNVMLATFVILAASSSALFANNYALADKERDDDGNCKPVGNNHDDNKASESQFVKHWNKDLCELTDCIDAEACEGDIRGQKEFEKFKQSVAWETSNEFHKGCFLERFDLPDGGVKTLRDYEVQDCGQGNY